MISVKSVNCFHKPQPQLPCHLQMTKQNRNSANRSKVSCWLKQNVSWADYEAPAHQHRCSQSCLVRPLLMTMVVCRLNWLSAVLHLSGWDPVCLYPATCCCRFADLCLNPSVILMSHNKWKHMRNCRVFKSRLVDRTWNIYPKHHAASGLGKILPHYSGILMGNGEVFTDCVWVVKCLYMCYLWKQIPILPQALILHW